MRSKLFKCVALIALVFGAGNFLASCNKSPSGDSQSQPSTEKVVWSGVDDINLDMGDTTPDLMAGVTATQGTTTLTVVVDQERSDEVDTSVAGAFSIYYVAYRGDVAISEDLDGEYVRTIYVSRGTYIDNNEFTTSSKTGWGGNGNGNSAMSWDIDTTLGALVVDITKSGDEYWQNQVEFNGLSVKAHTTYVVTIRAKSETPRNIGASLEVPSLGYRCIDTVSINSVGYTMTNEYADYNFYYTASENYDGVKFGILLGRFNELDESANKVYIDSVKITKAEKEANSTGVVFEGEKSVTISELADYVALDPVTAKDSEGNVLTLTKEGAVQGVEFSDDLGTAVFGEMWKYVDGQGNLSYFRRQINYRAPAPAREHLCDTLDGDFEYGIKFWTPEENGIVTITPNKAEKVVNIVSTKAAPSGEADWRAQLQQNNNGGKLEKNHAYKMVVEAKIDNTNVKSLSAEFCANAGGNPKAKFPLVFDAADTYQVFESDVYQPTADITGGAYRVGLLLGSYSDAYHLTVKSIHIIEVQAEVPYERKTVYETMDGEFDMGLKYWVKEENGAIKITDLGDGTVKINSTLENHGPNDWSAQLQQNNNGGILEAGHSYKAVVKAKTNNINLTTLRLEFCAGAGNPNAKKDLVFNAADTWQEFSTEVFTPAEQVSGGAYRVGLLLGEYASAYELVVDYIQIVEVL